jgi:uncharacterized lipoprotein YmbA
MIRYSIAAVVLGVFAAGCINLEPPPDPTRYFVMNGPDLVQAEAGFAVDVRSVTLEPYLSGPHIAVRLGENELRFSDVHRWAEPLEANIESVLEDYLALSPIGRVANRPFEEGRLIVRVHVDRFEGQLPAQARFVSRWSVEDASGNVIVRKRSDHALSGWGGSDYGQLVSMLESAVELLADEIASAI